MWASAKELWCGVIASNRLKETWRQPATTSTWDTLSSTAKYLIWEGKDETQVRRLGDGHLVWRRSGREGVFVQEGTERLFVVTKDAGEIVDLSNGGVLGRFPVVGRGMMNVHTEGSVVLVGREGPRHEAVYVIDGRSRARPVAKNIGPASLVVGDVLLSQNVGQSGVNRAVASLDAYSLSRFAPPQSELPSYQQVVAVLERYPSTWEAREAWKELRTIPDAMASLEKVIATEPPAIRNQAIAIASETGDPRFVAPLRIQLEGITTLPDGVEQWAPIVEIVAAMAKLRSPDATSSLLAFWQRIGMKVNPAWRRQILRDLMAESLWRNGARREWVQCRDGSLATSPMDPERAELGTRSPAVAYVANSHRHWGAICEARKDDNGDGQLKVSILQHGDTGGDLLRPYLVIGAGAGTEIDDFVAGDPTGRWVVVTKDMCVNLVDTRTGKATVLLGADGRAGDDIAGAHRAASFAPDGSAVLYIKSDGDRSWVVERKLPTGAERTIDPGRGELSRAYFDTSGQFIVMDIVVADTDGDGELRPPRLATTLRERRCRGPVVSASFYGQIGDRPIQRVAPVAGGATRDTTPGEVFQPFALPPSRYELVPQGVQARHRGDQVPLGPMHWEQARTPGQR